MNLFKLCFLIFTLTSCKPVLFFPERNYYGGGNLFKILPDNSFEYRETTHGKVYKFSRGIWKREGKKLLLFNKISDTRELPIIVSVSLSSRVSTELIVNVLPKQEILPSVLESFNLELVINNTAHALKNETNLMSLDQSSGNIYFRAYKKAGGPEIGYTILNDTLRSQIVGLKNMENKILTVEVDCNPLYFAQIKMSDDTLRIINDNKMKWGKIYLKRPN